MYRSLIILMAHQRLPRPNVDILFEDWKREKKTSFITEVYVWFTSVIKLVFFLLLCVQN